MLWQLLELQVAASVLKFLELVIRKDSETKVKRTEEQRNSSADPE